MSHDDGLGCDTKSGSMTRYEGFSEESEAVSLVFHDSRRGETWRGQGGDGGAALPGGLVVGEGPHGAGGGGGIQAPPREAHRGLCQRRAPARSEAVQPALLGAGWHSEPGLELPDGLRLADLPRYSPQLQPPECLWSVLDEPIASKYFETIEPLDAVVAERCRTLETSPDLFKGRTNFHRWPKTHRPN